jgi:hypothetical protein
MRATQSTGKNVKKMLADFDQIMESIDKERAFIETTLTDILSKGKS